ncbi:methyltransferase [uncultured Nevskia sp.]|uniref:methyltransferase n=1 Tax=uncultured Nevskia sp. TaxID=228950 RepID=UPI0025CE7A01|nr:methyltransferase [uncultured Nevskia sp.]
MATLGAAPPEVSWFDRFDAACNATIASPAFRRFAANFPLTRPIARRRARAVFDLVSGFVYSQVLLACVRLRLLEMLAEGPATVDQLAARCGLPIDGLQRLVDAAVALKLAARNRDGRIRLGSLGAPIAGDAGISALVEHHALFYADLGDPVALLRDGAREDGELARYWPYCANRSGEGFAPERVAAYSRLMSASQTLIADVVLQAYPMHRHRRVLDVGGGEGKFLSAVAARWSQLGLFLFDLPPVAERARASFAAQGLTTRTQAIGGSFLSDPLPLGADLLTLVRVLHDHDDASVMQLLRAAHAALPSDGRILIAEPMSDTPSAETVGDAYFGFYLLAMGRGRPRSPARIGEMLINAGFTKPRLIPTSMPLQTSVMVAQVSE